MSASAESLHTWSRRQWVRVIGAIVVVQVILVFAFSQRSLPRPRGDDSLTTVKLAPEMDTVRTLAGLGAVPDPTLFALMNRQGFSARTWLDFSFFHHSLNDWKEPAHWLALDAARFGQDFTRQVQTVELDRPLIDDKPAPRADTPEIASDISQHRSTVELSPELKGRTLVSALVLPPQAHSDILTNSIVQVVVNPYGNVLSARLVRGSGSKKADQAAIDLARHARFDPARPPESARLNPLSALNVGDLVFRWHTLPLMETNRVSAAPKK